MIVVFDAIAATAFCSCETATRGSAHQLALAVASVGLPVPRQTSHATATIRAARAYAQWDRHRFRMASVVADGGPNCA